MNIKEFFSLRKNLFFWGNLLAMAIVVTALIAGVFKWLEHYTRHDIAVTVPDVKGMMLNEAQRLLTDRKLVCIVSDSTYNTTQPGGIVLDMNPANGAIVKEGRTIYLTINTTRAPMRTLPNLIDNSSLREAEAKLLAMGFKLTPNDSVEGEKDWVYGIKYRGATMSNGDEVPLGATLTLEVGCGEYMMGIGDSLGIGRDTSPEEAIEIDDSWFE